MNTFRINKIVEFDINQSSKDVTFTMIPLLILNADVDRTNDRFIVLKFLNDVFSGILFFCVVLSFACQVGLYFLQDVQVLFIGLDSV